MKNRIYGEHAGLSKSAQIHQIEIIETDAALALEEAIRMSRQAAKTVGRTYAPAETPQILYVDPTAAIARNLKIRAVEQVIGMGIALLAQVEEDSMPDQDLGFYVNTQLGQDPVPRITYYQVYDGITPSHSLNTADRLEQAHNLSGISHMILQAQDERFFGIS